MKKSKKELLEIISFQEWELKDAEVAVREGQEAWEQEREAHAETRAELAQAYEDMRRMREEGFTGVTPRKFGQPKVVKTVASSPTPARSGLGKTLWASGGWSVPRGMSYSFTWDSGSRGLSFKVPPGTKFWKPPIADGIEQRALSHGVDSGFLPDYTASRGLKRTAAEQNWKWLS